MKKTLSTLILAGIVVLITGTFCFAEYAAAGVENFPYFHLGCLIVGGMIIVSLKQKYEKIYLGEAAGSFAMYAVLVALFTAPVAEGLRICSDKTRDEEEQRRTPFTKDLTANRIRKGSNREAAR